MKNKAYWKPKINLKKSIKSKQNLNVCAALTISVQIKWKTVKNAKKKTTQIICSKRLVDIQFDRSGKIWIEKLVLEWICI